MAHNLRFSKDLGNKGYFVPDSTIDFCELNYQYSFYIAEFFNALSSFIFVVYGIYTFINTRFKTCSVLLMGVGLGSALFHSTLLYKFQLMDELPMLWQASWLLYEVFKIKGYKLNIGFPLFLSLFGTAVHVYLEFPVLFFILHTLYQIPSFLFPWSYWNDNNCRRWTLEYVFYISFAFACWCVDQAYCEQIQYLHLHSFWHIFSGLALYKWLIMTEYISKNGSAILNKKNL